MLAKNFLISPFRIKQVLSQIIKMGYQSLPIVSMISLFTGMVLALQSAYQMQKMGAEMYIASLVSLSMTRLKNLASITFQHSGE